MNQKQLKAAETAEAVEALREMLPPGATVYTNLEHVSRSGMQREISLHIVEGGQLHGITGWASTALGDRIGKRGGLVVGGCGMDMGFHVVYNLSRTLYPKGHSCIGEKCMSNDHSNGDRNHKPHTHEDGGYALRHRWI